MALAERDRAPALVDTTGFRPYGKAKLDLRLPWPLARAFLLAVFAGMAVFGGLTNLLGSVRYHGELPLLVFKMDNPQPALGIAVVEARVQAIVALADSEAFRAELAKQSGVALTVEELKGIVKASRPSVAATALITVEGDDREVVEALTAHLGTAMDVTVDRYRAGALTVQGVDQRDPSADRTADYRGPLYIDPFSSGVQSAGVESMISQSGPRVVFHSIVGGGFGFLVMLAACLLAHNRVRTTTREDLDVVFRLPQLGSLPRPGRRTDRQVNRCLMGLAVNIDGAVPTGLRSVGLAGAGTPKLRASLTLAMSAALAAVVDRPVVVVDLDVDRPIVSGGPTWRRRARRLLRRGHESPGVLDVVLDAVPLESAIRPVPRRRIPRQARPLGRLSSISVIGPGAARDGMLGADRGIAEVVATLTDEALVVVHLPAIPGRLPVRSTLGVLDLTALVLLDGWTPVDDAQTVGDALEAATPNSVGYVVIAN